jgi:hypothetical protein
MTSCGQRSSGDGLGQRGGRDGAVDECFLSRLEIGRIADENVRKLVQT